MSDVAAYILAGGKSSRMGADKAFLEFEGHNLLERALQLAGSVTEKIFIVGSKDKFSVFGRVIEDVYPAQGPLAGIHAALATSDRQLNLILAVDLPFVQPAFLGYLVERARASGKIVTVPHLSSGYQPLCAVYRLEFASLAESALKKGRNKVDALFAESSVHVVEEPAISQFALGAAMFENLNTPEDWQRITRAPFK
jgi:molybdenum cofactor guanylyltransferase